MSNCNCHELQFISCDMSFNNYIKKALKHSWKCPVGNLLFNKGLALQDICNNDIFINDFTCSGKRKHNEI